MADIVSPKKRSSMMAAVRRQHTKPEINLRRALHKAGLRFRLHRRDLPGTPDLVFSSARVAVFVNGCFWHRHKGCTKSTTPATRTDFWLQKFKKNVTRDQRAKASLEAAGWKVIVVWECEVPTVQAAATLAKPIHSSIKKRTRVLAANVLNDRPRGASNAGR
ncbi:very short patch repair endonuclease [Bradyrhizobium sp.]|uniref:very short patch repair endonuclease n=1 Tax=Bradyrhizobium sp. TaxID=376 RepID=UPI002D3BDC36|nr:very short patch repair endonuclease [Bradyrhizobium sp.]HZR76767.1 very short patch repair endonuclease [Bradyrhizobium sp.]